MRKTLEQKIEESNQKQEQLKKEHDLLMAQFDKREQKAKNERIYKRGELVEKALPQIIPLTKEQFNVFMEKVMLTSHARRILKELGTENKAPADQNGDADAVQDGGTVTTQNGDTALTQDGGSAASKPTETPERTSTPPATKPAQMAQNGGTPAPKPTVTAAQTNPLPASKAAGAA